MSSLRMGFDSMAAWDKSSVEFEDHIQRRQPIPRTDFYTRISRTVLIESRLPTSTLPNGDLTVEPTTISHNSNNNHIPAVAPHISASNSHATEITSPGICCSIICAATHGQIEAVKFLISHGADVNPHVNHSSSSPLHQACHSNDIEMVRLLLSADAQVNVQNCYKTTPLMYAVKYGSPALVALVLSYYPRLEVPSFMGMTAAHWAVFNGRPEALVSLLRAGANPDAIMADGSTPLHCAAMNGTEEMASSLIAYGADIGLRDGQDRTVIEVALSNNREGVVAILRAAETQTLGRRR
ncbi:hypothetical protein MBLNU13_g10687t1 [Cladosporium sp. NU13]